MKRVALTFSIVTLLLLTFSGVGCKSESKGFEITNGSWGFSLQTPGGISTLVYTFEGGYTEGNVIYRGEVRGTFTVTADVNVRFTVNHYNADSEVFVYSYTGTISDFYNMGGDYSVAYPDGSSLGGTWTASR
ncbi:MAG: hypothetical protein GY765_35410 [bacterium]|nr:hypothetical protein [bacterium]